MTAARETYVVVDTMVMSSLMGSRRNPEKVEEANDYRTLIAGRRIVLSFATHTELRYGTQGGVGPVTLAHS